MHLQAARETNAQAQTHASTMAAQVDAVKLAELEAAQAAAQAALVEEMELLRRQKHAAEDKSGELEEQVGALM